MYKARHHSYTANEYVLDLYEIHKGRFSHDKAYMSMLIQYNNVMVQNLLVCYKSNKINAQTLNN